MAISVCLQEKSIVLTGIYCIIIKLTKSLFFVLCMQWAHISYFFCEHAFFILILLQNNKYYTSETVVCCGLQIELKIYDKIISRSRDPQGQKVT